MPRIGVGKAAESELWTGGSIRPEGREKNGGALLLLIHSVAPAVSKAAAGEKKTKTLARRETDMKSPKQDGVQETGWGLQGWWKVTITYWYLFKPDVTAAGQLLVEMAGVALDMKVIRLCSHVIELKLSCCKPCDTLVLVFLPPLKQRTVLLIRLGTLSAGSASPTSRFDSPFLIDPLLYLICMCTHSHSLNESPPGSIQQRAWLWTGVFVW